MNIIEELIEDLSKNEKKLSDLLIRAKVLAFKTKDSLFIDWIKSELNGYDKLGIPNFRKTKAMIMGDLFNGAWHYKNQNIVVPEELSFITDVDFYQGVSSLESFILNSEATVKFQLDAKFYALLSAQYKKGGYDIISANRVIGKSQLIGILTVVKTRLLDFLLELNSQFDTDRNLEENLKVLGEGKVSEIFTNNVFGDGAIINVAIGENISQEINIEKGNFNELEAELKKLRIPDIEIMELKKIIDSDNNNIQEKKIGKKTSQWMSTLYSKSLEGSYDISMGTFSGVLASAIFKYLGG